MSIETVPCVEAAFRTCEEIAFWHYENFPVASLFIPKEKRKYIAAIYAFARTADDFADEEGYADHERLARLAEMEEKLREAGNGRARDPIFVALGETIRRFQIPSHYFERLLTAFRMDVERKRHATWEDLLYYCDHSANPIGRLVLHLFEYRDESLMRRSDAICSGLQLANFWQDLSIDIRKGRIYLPLEDMRKFQLSEEEILQSRMSDNLCRLLEYEVERTSKLFEEGRPLLTSVGHDLRFQLKLTWLGGMRILKKIRRSNFDVLKHRPTLSFQDKFMLAINAITMK